MKKATKPKGASRDPGRDNFTDYTQQTVAILSDTPYETNAKSKEKKSSTELKKPKEKHEFQKRKYSFEQNDRYSKQCTQSNPLPRRDEHTFPKNYRERRDEEFPMPDLFSTTLSKAKSSQSPGASCLTWSNDLRCFKIVSKGNIIHDQSIYESDSTLETRGSHSNDGESPEKPPISLYQKFATSTHTLGPSSKGISIPSFLDM